MLEMILTLLLAVHLLAVNVASAGPLVCVWLHRRCFRHGDALAGQVGLRLARMSLFLFTLGVIIGAVQLGLLWWVRDVPSVDQRYFNAMRQFPAAKYWYTLGELLFFCLCMAPYVWLWNHWGERRFWHGLLAVLAATNLLYHFPSLMAMLAVIPGRADWQEVTITPDVYRRMILDGEVLARVVHVWLASVATTGVAVMILAMRATAQDAQPDRAARLASCGARVALVATLLQLLVGVWLLLTLPATAQSALLGEDTLGAGLMLLSLFAVMGLIHVLAAASIGDVSRRTVIRSTVLLVVIVVLMSGTLRRADQKSWGREAEVPSAPI